MTSKTFTCAECGGTFDDSWSDEEALTELKDTFGDIEPQFCATVCDDCYHKLLKNSPEVL